MDPDLNDAYASWLDAGTAASTRRAYAHDAARFWRWADTLSPPAAECYPIPVELLIRYVLDHLPGGNAPPLRIATLRRYLAALAVAHTARGLASPTRDPRITLLLNRAARALADPKGPQRKAAITAPILAQLLASCDASLHGIRDRALLWVGFASGGRRRDELVRLDVADVHKTDPGVWLQIRNSKTDPIGPGTRVPLPEPAAAALTRWLVRSGIRTGRVFRGINRDGSLNAAITGKSINLMVKKRIARIGLNPADYGAHSLRAGFMTECLVQGIPLARAMQYSGHCSVHTAHTYYRPGPITTPALDMKPASDHTDPHQNTATPGRVPWLPSSSMD